MQPANAAHDGSDIPVKLAGEDRQRVNRVGDHLRAIASGWIVAADLEIANHLDAKRQAIPARHGNTIGLWVAKHPDIVGAANKMRPRVPTEPLIIAIEPRAPTLLDRRTVSQPLNKRGNAGIVQRRESRAPALVPRKRVDIRSEFVARIVARLSEIGHVVLALVVWRLRPT